MTDAKPEVVDYPVNDLQKGTALKGTTDINRIEAPVTLKAVHSLFCSSQCFAPLRDGIEF